MRLFGIALALMVTACSYTQAPGPGGLPSWSFEDGTGLWQSADPAATLRITTDPNVTRGPEHGAVLEYSYTPVAGALAGVFCPTGGNVSGAKSLRLWLRTVQASNVLVAASEADGSNYHAAFTSLPGRWQEIALDFSEFQLGDESTDENGRLDGDQIAGVGIIDATGLIAQLAQGVPQLVPPELAPSLLWLDDVSLSPETVPPRWSVTEIEGRRAVRLDSFESSPLQWIALAGKGFEVEYDSEYKAEGEFSLRLHYELPPDKLMGILTSPKGPDLRTMKQLRLWLMTEVPTIVVVSLKEQDESDYSHVLELQPSNELEPFDLDLATFSLGGDSTDENGHLDLDHLKELSIADVSVLAGKPVPVNTLWVDDIVFTE